MMKKLVLLAVALAAIVAMSGCCWPGHWHGGGHGHFHGEGQWHSACD